MNQSGNEPQVPNKPGMPNGLGMAISIIVPAFKAERTIGACLEALLRQKPNDCEIIVVADDESREAIRALAEPRGARVLTPNHGAAAARNLGAENARGDLVLFVDADCVPEKNWIQAMTAPFADPQIVGAGGMKQTKQRGIVPRFIQMEFDYRYDNERNLRYIDFVDSGTAAYRRAIFLENGGFDTHLSDAEDVDLSYRLSELGYRMAFVENAVVDDQHPESLIEYLRRKFSYAFWRARVYARYPRKLAADSRTPQTQRLQGALIVLFGGTVFAAIIWREALWLTAFIVVAFVLTTLPFVVRFFKHDPVVAMLSPLFIALSAFAGSAGVGLGILRANVMRDA
jgi:cellulose synthase/poly-beta-1,6-N-acetylglucosamine synthase-like glycosyltransferase